MQTFSIAPAGIKGLWLLLLVLVPVAIAVTVLVVTMLGARTARFEVAPDGLRIRGDFYGRFIAAADLRVDAARQVDLTVAPELAPARRTLGTGLPGYQAGWFRLRNGERALVYLTDRTKAVHVPTGAGFALLLSPSDPEGFIRALTAVRR
jgi:hypothetical protein